MDVSLPAACKLARGKARFQMKPSATDAADFLAITVDVADQTLAALVGCIGADHGTRCRTNGTADERATCTSGDKAAEHGACASTDKGA